MVGASPYEDFWTASSWSSLTQRRMGERLAEYRSAPALVDPLALPGALHPLPRPADPLQDLLARRRSDRSFGPGPLTTRQVGDVLAALSTGPDGRRGHPSAGGFGALRYYPLLLDADHELTGRVTRYDSERHALQDVAECPSWTDVAAMIGAVSEAAEQPPQLVLAVVLDDSSLMDKYGERGGRFGLIEAGAAIQSVGLRIAAAGLGGCVYGGAADREILGLLGLGRRPVRLAAVMTCGRLPAVGRRTWWRRVASRR